MDLPFGRWSRWLDRYCAVCLWLAALCIAAICALMITQALTREFAVREIGAFGLTIKFRGLDDIVAWLCADSALLALPAMFRHGDLVRMTLLSDRLGPQTRRHAELGCLGFALVFVGYTAYAFFRFVRESWEIGDMANGLIVVPLWIPQLPMVFGIAGLWLAILEDFARVARRGTTTYDAAAAERAARQDYSESL